MSTVVSRQEALDELGEAFRTVSGAMRRLQGRETHRAGEVSFAQYKLLFELDSQGEATVGDLALATAVSAASTSQMVDGLAEAGLVERTKTDADRRRVVIRLTAKGKRRVAARKAEYEPRWRNALSGFDTKELATAAGVLSALAEMFDEFAAERDQESGARRPVSKSMPPAAARRRTPPKVSA